LSSEFSNRVAASHVLRNAVLDLHNTEAIRPGSRTVYVAAVPLHHASASAARQAKADRASTRDFRNLW
jgi:hypothetical protein